MISRNEQPTRGGLHLRKWQITALLMMAYDVLAIYASYYLALLVRFDLTYSQIPTNCIEVAHRFLPIYCVLCVVVFWLFKL